MITIINYGLGNIRAFANVYERLKIKTKIVSDANGLSDAERIILPGVGSFDHAMNLLNNSGMRDLLDRKVLLEKVPVVGICLGMQIMAKRSDEGKNPGLGWIEGEVKLFDKESIPYATRYPHMGWNSITPVKQHKILEGINEGSRFYFLHSYYFSCFDENDILTHTKYGITYVSAVNHENVYGIQYHPEKSHSNGVQLLKNFSQLS
jgi:glutamine amidotransferase